MTAHIERDPVDALVAHELKQVAKQALEDFVKGDPWGIPKKDVKALIRASNHYNLPEDHIKFK